MPDVNDAKHSVDYNTQRRGGSSASVQANRAQIILPHNYSHLSSTFMRAKGNDYPVKFTTSDQNGRVSNAALVLPVQNQCLHPH